MTQPKKKLIEVALPLEAINVASAREKSIRHGHPSTLHLWWARRPLAACRAVLFASLVDNPSSLPEQFPTEAAQDAERQRLFAIIEDLVKWESTTNEAVLEQARAEIRRSTGGNPPPVLDPFCGGGSIPLEAQRLGLEAHASDLNPVAVLITKALIEIPPRFAGQAPINPDARKDNSFLAREWPGAHGLAEDVRWYGKWMRDQAFARIGHLYPKVRLPQAQGAAEATVIAWLWARTVICPNPACGARMPLVRSFALSTKKGKETYVAPIVERGPALSAGEQGTLPGTKPHQQTLSAPGAPTIRFDVRSGKPKVEGTVDRRGATCVACGSPVPFKHVRAEGQSGRMSQELMAIVVEGQRGRIYISPIAEQVETATEASPSWQPDSLLPHNPRDFKTPNYGLTTFADLFTPRQLVALTTFSDLVGKARTLAKEHALAAGLPDDPTPLAEGGYGAQAYADAVAVYLGMAVSRQSDYLSAICSWHSGRDTIRNTFARQAIPMVWDFAEVNPFSSSTGHFLGGIDWISKVCEYLPGCCTATAMQLDAAASIGQTSTPTVATDPPYYDNIGYADLSDFFYVWMRRSIGSVYPQVFSTLMVPKSQELVATPYRHDGSKDKAREFFESGFDKVFQQVRQAQHVDYPVTLFYAFKQAETNDKDELASTGWETMLEGMIRNGFEITGTWPMRSELSNRPVASGTNALASSIVLVARPRAESAPITNRRDFAATLQRELRDALPKLQQGSIAPVDLAQAAIGPGMAVFSRYSKVLEPDGGPMRVRTALGLINQAVDEVLSEQVGELDAETRWALSWFEQRGTAEGPYGEADVLARARDVGVNALAEAGIVRAGGGKVRLLPRDELPPDWNPEQDGRLSAWKIMQQLIRALQEGGESGAGALLHRLGGAGHGAKELAYRVFQLCERWKWTQEALAYNSLVASWPEIVRQAETSQAPRVQQMESKLDA